MYTAAVAASGACTASAKAFAACLTSVIINPILALIFAAGLLVFIWGVVQFMFGLSSEASEEKEAGKRHMLWGIVGMFIMAGAYSLIKILANTIGPSATHYFN